MKKLVQFFCFVFITASFVITDIPAPLLGSTPVAEAEAREKKRSFLQRIFGKRKKRLKRVKKGTGTVRGSTTRKTAKKKYIAPLPKIDEANRIVVIGDSTADAVAKGLTNIYKRTPSVVISPRIKHDVSVIGDKFYPWLDASDFTFLGERVRAVVVALGTHDRGPITNGEETLAFGAQNWERAYKRRLVDVLAQLQLLNVPIIWLLPPPVVDDQNTEKAAVIAAIQRNSVQPLNFSVVDARGGFVNREGKFRKKGVNLNGKRVSLRDWTGIGFTRGGAKKLAYYVQKEIDTILDDQLNQGLVFQAGSDGKRNAQQIAILTRPALIQGAELAGGNGRVSAFYKDARARDYFVGGKSVEAPVGRADNFKWTEPDKNDLVLAQ